MSTAIDVLTQMAAELARREAAKEFLTAPEAAEMMHREVRSIYRAIKEGHLPASRPGGRGHFLIRRADLERFIEGER